MAKVLVAAIAPLYHPTTGRHERGAKFEMEQADVQRYVDAKLAVQLSEVEEVKTEPTVDIETSSLDQLKAVWDVALTPNDYLEKFPNGPHSDLALRIVELEAEATEKP